MKDTLNKQQNFIYPFKMKKTVVDGNFIIFLNEKESSFITQINYKPREEVLSIVMKDTTAHIYKNVPIEVFFEFQLQKSFGGYYNSNIKSKFQKMAEEKKQPDRINKAKKEKRFIKLDIDVTKIDKSWLYKGEKGGVYLKMTLHMLPDGEVDRYGRLGFITQDVPIELAKKDKELKGEILGNGEELEWVKQEEKKTLVDSAADIMDDLPF